MSDDHQVTDICIFFCAAAYYAKFFEASLAEFLVTCRLAEKVHLHSDVQTLEEMLHKKTMFAVRGINVAIQQYLQVSGK